MVLAICGRKIKDNLGFLPINTVTVGLNFHIWLSAHSWPTMKVYFYTIRQNMLLAYEYMVIPQVLYSDCYIYILFQHGASFWINDGTQLQLCFHSWLQLENKTEFHLWIYALKKLLRITHISLQKGNISLIKGCKTKHTQNQDFPSSTMKCAGTTSYHNHNSKNEEKLLAG